MRPFDGIRGTLARNGDAKDRAVEVEGLHRSLAARLRRCKEKQTKNVTFVAEFARIRPFETQNEAFRPQTRPNSSFSRAPGEVKRTSGFDAAGIAELSRSHSVRHSIRPQVRGYCEKFASS
jgi:hypothetical protein